MAQPNEEKEVLFHLFCPTCEYYESPQDEDPCESCLDAVTNYHSIKPINYKEAAKKR